MYLDFYSLKTAPFHITPDPEFLFLSPSHKAALGALVYSIEERQGFVALVGEVGLGETTILRSYLERVDQRQLKQRLVIRATISPLTDKESLEYIAHRLAKVRLTDAPIFTRGALLQIIKHAKGTPRVLNILCSSALIQGFGARQHHISARIA